MSDSEESFSEGELSRICQKALYVRPAARPIDLNTVPADGNEFIHRTRLEASLTKFPKVERRSALDDDKLWKRKAAAEFSYFAIQLKNDKEMLKQRFPQSIVIPLDNEIKCCSFCLGSEKCSNIYKSEENVFSEEHLPLLNYVIHLKQSELRKLLKYTFKWYKITGMDININRWIFSILACIDKPLSHDLKRLLDNCFDDLKEYLKSCEGEESRRVHLIMSLLENYFLVKSNHGIYFNHFS